MAKLNKVNFILRLKSGTRANLEKVSNYFLQGEPVYTTDTGNLFIADANNIPQPIASLDMAVVFEGEVITNNNEIVFTNDIINQNINLLSYGANTFIHFPKNHYNDIFLNLRHKEYKPPLRHIHFLGDNKQV